MSKVRRSGLLYGWPGMQARLMVEAGRWPVADALAKVLLPTLDHHHPVALEALCPLLPEAQALESLRHVVQHPPDARQTDTIGLRTLLARLRGHPEALSAYRSLSPAHRIQCARAVVEADPAAVVHDAFAHVGPWWPPYDVTTALLKLLPWVPPGERTTRARQALDVLFGDEPDEEYPTEPHHLGSIAVVDAELALSLAHDGWLAYPCLQDHAHIARRMPPGKDRERVEARWISTLQSTKPDELRLTNLCMPTPLSATSRAALLSLLDTRKGRRARTERAYVLVRLAADEPTLVPAAHEALAKVDEFQRALGTLALAAAGTEVERVGAVQRALHLLRRVPSLTVSELLNGQKGWLSDEPRERMLADFRAEAIARLPMSERMPHIDALISDFGETPNG